MGVKHFYIHVKKNYKECINNDKDDFKNKNIHNVCIDMNGIIHSCAQEIYEYGNFKKNRLLTHKNKLTLKNQLRLFNKIGDTIENIRNTIQPTKRIILCIDGVAGCAKMAQQRQRRFKSSLEYDEKEFNSNCISAGTKFMNYLSKYIDWYIRFMISTNDYWKDLEVVFSSEKVPGEGEHKIINYIRKLGKESESFCIHGLDADLIMLGMSINNNDMYIYRENYYRGVYEHSLVDINKLKGLLINRLRWDQESNKKFNKNVAITDFVFMCFLVGNDFLPNIPCLAILEGGIDSMIDVYKNVCGEYGHLTLQKKVIGNMLNLESLEVFVGTLAQYENGLLQEKVDKLSQFIEDPLLKKHTDHGKLDFDSYKESFYATKLANCNKEDLSLQYIEGLNWVINYYKLGIPSWKWYYPYFYAPFLTELVQSIKNYKYKKTIDNPINNVVQLISVLPQVSHNLLPHPYNKIVMKEMRQYYPSEFEVDCSGKRKEWEGIVLVCMVDIDKVEKVFDKYKDNMNDQDKRLCHIDHEYTYKYKDNGKLFKSFYGDIHECNVLKLKIIS